MRYSGIGGQAVMEGVMMKNQEKYAVAVRKPDGEIALEVSEYKGIIKNKKIRNMPVLRGVFSFIESLYLCLLYTSPYVFSLVFALMSRNKGNFLFRLPRPPYQAVLRKFVSLPF